MSAALKVEQTPLPESLNMDQHLVRKAINACLAFASKNDIRYYLNGVLLEVTDTHMNFVATDGHTLLLVPIKLEYTLPNMEKQQFILQRDSATLLVRALKTNKSNAPKPKVTITFPRNDKGSMDFSTVDAKQNVSLIDGRFPDYHRVIPKDINGKTLVSSVIGINANYIARISTVAPLLPPAKGVRMHPRGENDSIKLQGNIDGTKEDLTIVLMPMRL